jgi:ribokinase
VISSEPPADENPSVVVVGSLNLDIVVPVPHHPAPGETVLGGDSYRNPGGKGANQAVAAARLGQRVAMVGRVGDDEAGALLVISLEHEGVDAGAVKTTTGVPSGIALIAVDEHGENTIVVSPGANGRVSASDVSAAAPLLVAANIVLLQLEIPIEAIEEAAKLAQGRVILNPAPAATLPLEVLERVDVLVPNRTELARLTKRAKPGGMEELVDAARSLRGPGAVVVTLGELGALVIEKGRSTHVPVVSVEAVDTTAAGDCFCAALADSLARGSALEDAARWGTRAAAIAITRKGAQASLPRRDEVERATP